MTETKDQKDEPLLKIIGALIRKRRIELGMPCDVLAKSVGLTRASINNIEFGRQEIVVSRLHSFCEALEIDILDLLQPLSSHRSVHSRLEAKITKINEFIYANFGVNL